MSQGRLFETPLAPAPRPIPRAQPVAAVRPEGWAAPTKGEHACDHPGCGGRAVYGDGGKWFCVPHRPPGFLMKDRVAS